MSKKEIEAWTGKYSTSASCLSPILTLSFSDPGPEATQKSRLLLTAGKLLRSFVLLG